MYVCMYVLLCERSLSLSGNGVRCMYVCVYIGPGSRGYSLEAQCNGVEWDACYEKQTRGYLRS